MNIRLIHNSLTTRRLVRRGLRVLSLPLLAILALPVFADEAGTSSAIPAGSGIRDNSSAPAENTEQNLSQDAGAVHVWANENLTGDGKEKKTETKTVEEKVVTTKKLKNVVPPILFKSGKADIPAEYVEKLRNILDGMRDRINVRLHFVGHTDNQLLHGEVKERYGDNNVLSKERAGTTAEYFQQALALPPEAISYEGMGDTQPVASNNSEAGRAKNRRVEVQVWYDEVRNRMVDKEVELEQGTKLIKVCRVETVCKIRYKQGYSRRAKLKNLVAPFHYDEGMTEIPESYLRQLREALSNLRTKQNVQMRFIAYTDNIPLTGRDARIYGDHTGLSKARARRMALAIQEAMHLPNTAIQSDGRGATNAIATNDSEKGRAMNRRIEVEFWHDDPLEDLPDEPQICPESSAAETVEREYNPPDGDIKPVYFKDGQPIIPPGYAKRLQRVMEQIADKGNVRLKFVGYINNERLDRRTAMVYEDDIGLSTARARRVMEAISNELALAKDKTSFEGHGFVQSQDVVNAGFIELDQSRVEVKVVYDELALMEDSEGLEIERLTRDVETKNPYALNLMRITVDGQPLHDPGKSIPDVQRCTDVALDKANVRFKYDNLQNKPRLNVTGWPNVISSYDDVDTDDVENQINFTLYSNYPSYFERAEVRVFRAEQSTRDEPVSVVALDKTGKGAWKFDQGTYKAPRLKFKYVMRVYDKDDHFDETAEQDFWIVNEKEKTTASSVAVSPGLTGYGENRLAVNNIPLNGGTIRVNGSQVPEGYQVWFAGQSVPVSPSGEFAAEFIAPRGLHSVELAITDKNGNGRVWLRDLELERNDWFYVGIADVTLAQDSTNGPAELVTGDKTHYDNDLSLDGRLAYYVKGHTDGGWKVTSSADTREGPLDDIFSNFLNKSPDAVFRRMDPDHHYSTYGDDSTIEEDAPTSGKFYLKVEKEQDYGLWGNFDIDYLDTTLSQVDRSLYGANLNYESVATTEFGERQFLVNTFAAEPGTVAGRDEFLGTNGSLYYMRRQDIVPGSDRLRIEYRDTQTGTVVAVKKLQQGLDYDIDYIQGRVMLSQPLSGFSSSDLLVNSGDSGGNHAYLVARYEYTPGFDELNDVAIGGRVHYWFNDNVKLGVTAQDQETTGQKSSLNGVDVTWRKSAATWVRLESSSTTGSVSSNTVSSDGGFNFNDVNSAAGPDTSANGQRIDGSLRVAEVFDDVPGQVTFYNQKLDAGYSAPGLVTTTDSTQTGMAVEVPVANDYTVQFKSDKNERKDALETGATELDVKYKINKQYEISGGVRKDTRTDNSPVVPLTQRQGDRTDAQLRLGYNSLEDWTIYGYLQDTLSVDGNRDENGRIGVGGDYRITDRFKVKAEVSSGDLGEGIHVGTDYQATDTTNLYLNYALENDYNDFGVRGRRGNMVGGFRSRYSDSASVFMEEKYSHGDVPTGLLHSMGIDMSLTDAMSIGGHLDMGTLVDNITGAETQRNAYGVRLGYKSGDFTYAGAVEYRTDETQQPDTSIADRTTWLMRNSVKYKLDADWRLIGKLNWSQSESSLGAFYNGDFTEAVFGTAYRPVSNDRLNMLFKYTYFYNLPSVDQLTIVNTAAEYIQKSHIFSLDATYDLTSRWSIGGKYAYRNGQISQDRSNPEYFDNDATLTIARLDWHVTHKWDVLTEWRSLTVDAAGDTRSGMLIGCYRHLGENIKLGAGYNYTDFSDDLTDLDYDSQGWFINIIGKI